MCKLERNGCHCLIWVYTQNLSLIRYKSSQQNLTFFFLEVYCCVPDWSTISQKSKCTICNNYAPEFSTSAADGQLSNHNDFSQVCIYYITTDLWYNNWLLQDFNSRSHCGNGFVSGLVGSGSCIMTRVSQCGRNTVTSHCNILQHTATHCNTLGLVSSTNSSYKENRVLSTKHQNSEWSWRRHTI